MKKERRVGLDASPPPEILNLPLAHINIHEESIMMLTAASFRRFGLYIYNAMTILLV
jgi:hypothetical protein